VLFEKFYRAYLIHCCTNFAEPFHDPGNLTTQETELLQARAKSDHEMFSQIIQPRALPPLLMEPPQPILWSRLPELKGNVKQSSTSRNHCSALPSHELLTGQVENPSKWCSHHFDITRGVDLMVRPTLVPFALSSANDYLHLSLCQAFLRLNIEAFAANHLDAAVRLKGRTKPVYLNQVGIRCRHCAHVPTMQRVKGAVYFPSTTLGLYQAAQNMRVSHLQCGLCPEMPQSIKTLFAQLLETKTATLNSAGGRNYWAQCTLQKGLMDTEMGIFPVGM
jgi:hypothetical protein